MPLENIRVAKLTALIVTSSCVKQLTNTVTEMNYGDNFMRIIKFRMLLLHLIHSAILWYFICEA